ncbi:AbgT family transporter [Escherichia coli]|uniref:AbgT family transporter n=1 Tax=Escherichia coli TaxID=562 RepID=UPI002101A046|nr:AbgT family transporter [Escherichia coli]MCQ1684182.1 AbgT family transporter [Escherichia coli]
MSMSSIPSSSQSGKLYGWVERIGNKVPHPFLLFIYLIIVLMVTTAILSAFGVSAKNPTDGTPVVVKNLLSVEGLHWFLPNVIKNFSGFAPLGAILALVLGAGLAERVGLLPALMVKMASHVNARYASYMVLFIAFFSHISSDAALVIMPPMKEMAGFIVMVFPLAQFVAMFNWSNMGKFIAVGLTDILESSGLSGIPAFVGLALLSSFLCMFIASGSAIWSILAPIFVPMFMLLGFHPAFAQILFRIADSSVLPLAPVSPFVPLFLGFLQRYKPDAKLGTYYSLVLPYPLIFLVVWLLMLLAWYLVGLPIGPGIYPRLS